MITVRGWITIDEDECMRFWEHKYKPKRASSEWFNNEEGCSFVTLDPKYFPDLTFQDEPLEVELSIKLIGNGNS